VNRARLLLAAAFVLALLAVGWFVRTGRYKERRLAFFTCALGAAFLLLSRRVGLAELGILAGLVLFPLLILPQRRR
jgi:hypothetical protein